MGRINKDLPPLAYLVAFEAAARYQSFTIAADELCITQAAVSRQIRLLEDNLGCELFNRSHKAVTLTADGRRFQRSVTAALELLSASASELKVKHSTSTVTVCADLSIASLWLIPKLPLFRMAHPQIIVHVDASDDDTRHISDGADAAIQFGDGHWPDCNARFLLEEEIFLVCSPAYLASISPLNTPADLLDATLIHCESEHWDWMDWSSWLAHKNVPLPPGRQDLFISNYPAVIQAALGGQGIALGWRHLVDDLLASGALVRPIAASVQSRRGFYLVHPSNRLLSKEAHTFCEWAIDQCTAQPPG
ncbi:LysR substrate-binding domain-containing protein [Marinobacterium rhizophilum]|uniref:LysR family transcriptional regulator n=1 Tax=Marinobacterium rhizophilum TaxID=420402 RepID=A0ABY5HPM0_9GAMM|nr:LysR substrate-binding domain-containing protein [Marinobacterium rhizophilum]UTW13130.1 LysR family transcriptional regulator [Marinobacterium rhizophilum]